MTYLSFAYWCIYRLRNKIIISVAYRLMNNRTSNCC